MSLIQSLGDPTSLLGKKMDELLPANAAPVRSTQVPAKAGVARYQLDEFDLDHDGAIDTKRYRTRFGDHVLFRDNDNTMLSVYGIRTLVPGTLQGASGTPARVVQVIVEQAERRVLTDHNHDGKDVFEKRVPMGTVTPLASRW